MKKSPKTVRQTVNQLRGLFLTMGLVLLVSAAVVFLAGQGVLIARDEVQMRDEILRRLQSVFSTVQDAETGQRGYLLTGDAQYLAPYREALEDIRKRLAGLRELAGSAGIPPGKLAEFDVLIRRKTEELARTVDLAERGQRGAALEIMRGDGGKGLMDDIRRQVNGLEREQEDKRAKALRDVSRSTFVRTGVFLATVLINLGFLGWAYSRICREMSLQYVAALETERQREILAVTLSSIGDAVILTDTHGRITFVNTVAERLTGWTAAEAVDRLCLDVFKIIDEQNRRPVESPVDRVLAKGEVVGLSGQTLLLRKDGTELPIDDSGAPIREADGTMRGVVLVFRDFTIHRNAERALMEAKEAVEAASRAKDQFLSTLSHELRTPLTPVVATLSAWEAGQRLPEEFRPDLRILRRNAELEARLIDGLLDLTRIQHGRLSLEKEVVDVHGILEAVSELFRADAGEKGLSISLSRAAEESFVEADSARLQQVFWNLVGNAVKFGEGGGLVKIHTANRDGLLEVVVEDDGPGMTVETIGRLFEQFQQGGEHEGNPGLGLGMSIARALVEAHGGTICAASEGLGRGSRFTVRLPVVASPEEQKPSKPGLAGVSSKRLRILLLEDHRDTAQVLGQILQSLGHEVQIQGTVAEAIAAVDRREFDVILSDIGLPDGTGMDFMREVRKTLAIPALALTGYGMAEDVEACLAAGFTSHLTKPVDFERLLKTLDQFAKS